MFSKKQIQDILNIFKGTLIIDEAYVDYSNDEQGMLKLCLSNDRIILFRTFSKKFLASGYRVGYMITKKNIEGMRNTIISPHSVSSYSENFFVTLLNDKKQMQLVYEVLKDLAGIQKFDEIVPFIKIWVNNEIFSKTIIKRLEVILK